MWHKGIHEIAAEGARNHGLLNIAPADFFETKLMIPQDIEEQKKIGKYFEELERLITLHQRITPYFLKINAFVWEQRKLGDVFKEYSEKNHTELPALTIIQGGGTVKREDSDRNLMYDKSNLSNYKMVRKDDFIVHLRSFEGGLEKASSDGIISPAYHTFHSDVADSRFYYPYFRSHEFIKHKLVPHVYGIRDGRSIDIDGMKTIEIPYTSTEEQQKIGDYLESIDHHITLHQRKPYFWNKFIVIDWEQRKLLEFVSFFNGLTYTPDDVEETGTLVLRSSNVKNGEIVDADNVYVNDKAVTSENVHEGDIIVVVRNGSRALIGKHAQIKASMPNTVIGAFMSGMRSEHSSFVNALLDTSAFENEIAKNMGATINQITGYMFSKMEFMIPSGDEQQKIGEHFQSLDNLITLHHHKLFIINGLKLFTAIQCKCYLLLNISNKNKKTKKEIKLMPELERVIEEKLIDQLVYGDSQWTYREDLKTEEDLWRNFKYILEQNNKDRLNGESLSDAEFEQVKNQLQFSSFYKAGEWLVGENGKVMVHVQRDTEKLHLVVMNHEHIAGGSSVYEVINQYSALKDEDDYYTVSRNRRFDVTLMINGLPMIHRVEE